MSNPLYRSLELASFNETHHRSSARKTWRPMEGQQQEPKATQRQSVLAHAIPSGSSACIPMVIEIKHPAMWFLTANELELEFECTLALHRDNEDKYVLLYA